MLEISLHILDIVQNSMTANADKVHISVTADTGFDTLNVKITDNGVSMTEDEAQKALSPFYTTKTGKKTGFGLAFFKESAERTGGYLKLNVKKGVSTQVEAQFKLSHIDRPPLGDMAKTFICFISLYPDRDFSYTVQVDNRAFCISTEEIKKALGSIPITSPEVTKYIGSQITQNTAEITGKTYI